jgi:hypothetical protein
VCQVIRRFHVLVHVFPSPFVYRLVILDKAR